MTESDLSADDFTACQRVGTAVAWLGYDGMVVPSARADDGNVVILVDPAASGVPFRRVGLSVAPLTAAGARSAGVESPPHSSASRPASAAAERARLRCCARLNTTAAWAAASAAATRSPRAPGCRRYALETSWRTSYAFARLAGRGRRRSG
jgi:hypothetical protein